MQESDKGCISTNRNIEFANPKTKKYFEWLDSLSAKKFEAIIRYEWNKVLLLFGKGDENYKLNLSIEEMEKIYGGN